MKQIKNPKGKIMFIYTVKASTLKTISLCVVTVIALGLLIAFMPTVSKPIEASDKSALTVSKNEDNIVYGKIKNVNDMNSFIKKLGWQVEENPIEIVDVQIPNEFNNVYLKYNEIQKSQGLNLEKYKGKVAKRYTYVIKNYPNTTETVYLNIIILKNKVIAGDVCSADVSGFVHGMSISDAKSNTENG